MRFKRFAIGLAIYILTILFIVFVNRAFNARPSNVCNNTSYPRTYNAEQYRQSDLLYDNCNKEYQQKLANHDRNSFITVTIMSVVAIIVGVLVMAVGPVSWGLILAGLTMIIYILIANFEDVGKPWRAVITGAALAVLIWLSYAKLGDKERISNLPDEVPKQSDNMAHEPSPKPDPASPAKKDPDSI